MGTAAGTAGLGGFLLDVRLRRLLQRLGDEAVIFTQPATEVNHSAAGTAKRRVGPFRPACPVPPPIADWAAYALHRKLRSKTSTFSSPAWPTPPPCGWRPCRLYRSCRTCRTS